jgi:transcriptional regulator of acetoin/glycerol metabolism
LRDAVAAHRGNCEELARVLDMSQRTLYCKLRQLAENDALGESAN